MHKMKGIFDGKNLSDYDEEYHEFVQAAERCKTERDLTGYIALTSQAQALLSSMRMLHSDGGLALEEFGSIKDKIFEQLHAARDAMDR